MATPRRVRERMILRPIARPRPTTMVMNRDHGISVSPIWKPLVPKNRLMCRVSWGSQISPARPMRASMRPTVVTICATRGASAIARMRTRSMIAPMSGAATNTVRMQGDEGLDAPVDLELPEHVREEHADRALGEVEDARRRVGDDQAGGGDRVHGAVGDADDQPERDRVQRDRVAGPRDPADDHRRRWRRRCRRRSCGGSPPRSPWPAALSPSCRSQGLQLCHGTNARRHH